MYVYTWQNATSFLLRQENAELSKYLWNIHLFSYFQKPHDILMS